jgi:hypothetical protein
MPDSLQRMENKIPHKVFSAEIKCRPDILSGLLPLRIALKGRAGCPIYFYFFILTNCLIFHSFKLTYIGLSHSQALLPISQSRGSRCLLSYPSCTKLLAHFFAISTLLVRYELLFGTNRINNGLNPRQNFCINISNLIL